jgi:hypothetical protein
MRRDGPVTTPVLVGRWPQLRYPEADAVPAAPTSSMYERMLGFAMIATGCEPSAAAENVAAVAALAGQGDVPEELFRLLVDRLVRAGLLPPLVPPEPPATPTVAADRFQGSDQAFPGHWRGFPTGWRPEPSDALVLVATRALPVATRVTVLLVDVAGLSPAAASAVMGVAEEDARDLVHHGRAAIRSQVERALAPPQAGSS